MNGLEQRALSGDQTPFTYDEAKQLARHADPAVRIALANRTDIKAEILFFLSQDKDPAVRGAAAENGALPSQADLILARDGDGGVRTGLARKVSQSGAKDDAHHDRTATLNLLSKDQQVGVREVLAENLKNDANAPAEVIKRLAMDKELSVCGPVLENSPVLTDADLIDIIRESSAKGAVGAISRRSEVSELVSDAVVESNDIEGIADLLGNASAQIREETLDNLVDQARDIEAWHAPLVGRPKLPAHAAGKLASFVDDALVAALTSRADFDAETMRAVEAAVQERGADASRARAQTVRPEPSSLEFLLVDPPITVADRLYKAGKLDEKVVSKALLASDNAFVVAAIAVRGDIAMEIVQAVFNEKSAKGILALCWKARLSVKLAVQVQQRMARLAPSEVLGANDVNYPLTDDELAWQFDFFRDLAARQGG